MDDLSKKLAAQLDVLARTVLALEAYLSQTRVRSVSPSVRARRLSW